MKSWLWFAIVFALSVGVSFAQTNSTSADSLPKLLPPYGEIPPTFWEQHGTTVIISALLALLIVALGVWLWLRPKPVVVQPPDIQARAALEAFLSRPEDGLVLSQVSQILRRYVLAAFELPLGEPTTAEFCRLIASRDSIGTEFSSALASFLNECDERKFAGLNPDAPLRAAGRALELVTMGETRRSQWRQQAAQQAAQPAAAST